MQPKKKNYTYRRQEINALIKLLPDYVKFQQLINETLHSQLPKNFCKKAHRIAIDLVLIHYHGEHQERIDEVYRSQSKSGTRRYAHYKRQCWDRYELKSIKKRILVIFS